MIKKKNPQKYFLKITKKNTKCNHANKVLLDKLFDLINHQKTQIQFVNKVYPFKLWHIYF